MIKLERVSSAGNRADSLSADVVSIAVEHTKYCCQGCQICRHIHHIPLRCRYVKCGLVKWNCNAVGYAGRLPRHFAAVGLNSLVRLMNQADNNFRDYCARVRALCNEFGISAGAAEARGLALCPEPTALVTVALSVTGNEMQLTPEAAYAWAALRAAAVADGVELCIVSAFRSIERQAAIVRRKLANGVGLDAILAVNAPPGYSEHHSGCAIDIGTPGCPDLEEVFEATPAYGWLAAHAAEFGFVLSFPRNNAYGYGFEPWHWCYRPVGWVPPGR